MCGPGNGQCGQKPALSPLNGKLCSGLNSRHHGRIYTRRGAGLGRNICWWIRPASIPAWEEAKRKKPRPIGLGPAAPPADPAGSGYVQPARMLKLTAELATLRLPLVLVLNMADGSARRREG